MKLTTKGKFAVTALLDIAIYSNSTPMTLCTISERQGISVSYLEQLFVKLRRFGMVKSYKGPGGGYVLAKDLNKISVSEIIKAVDDDMDARSCNGMRNCNSNNKQCLTHDLWNGLTNHVYNYLDNITLNDLVSQSKTSIIKLSKA
ncbi:MAG: Rrf2 family transcriptional regulator, iron-sulfur cluster assembly transcription factor [Pseudomonadota bacterium]|nr:Rrf2 family transcriptional regulator, iron-sulfur cluster assembly transcription factor [Pseudomonadota bacterium]